MKPVKFFAGLFLFAVFAVPLACIAQEQPKADPLVQVMVEKGDCLIRICQKYLEKPEKWRTISQINKMKNPDFILPGQTILFPASLMKGTPVAGTVTFIKGRADLKPKGKEEWNQLALDDKVGEGAMIRTGDESSVEIKFEDGNTFLLKPNTTIGLQTARASGDNYSRYKMSLNVGKLVSNVQKATGKESAVQIEAPTAVLGVRGTVFRSFVALDGTTQFEVLEGEVVVEGQNEMVAVKQGEGTVVYKGAPPIAPKKLLEPPALASAYMPLYKKLPVSLSFSKVEGAVSYRVVLANDREIKDILKEKVIGTQDVFEITNVEDGTYFMQSTSIDEIGLEGTPSETVEIRIRVNPLPPFVEVPADRAGYKTQSLKCKWLKVSDAERYYVQIAEDNEFKQLIKEQDNVVTPEYVTGNLEYKNYYFRVSSIASDKYQGEWSDALAFELLPPPASPPVDAPEIDKNEIRIRWQNLGKDITYHFQMSKDGDFKNVLLDRMVENPEITFAKPKEAGTYYVRISGVESEGREGGFSKPQTFEIKRSNLGFIIITGIGIFLLGI